MFIRIAIVLISLTSAVSYAATATANELAVTIPKLKPGFEYDIAAIFLKAGASNLNYVINNKGLPLQSPSWTETEVKPTYAPGFELGIRYNICDNSGSYAKLNWTHLNNYTNTSIAADGLNYFLGPDYEIGPAGIPIRHAYGTARFLYDVVNLDLGQYASFGSHFDMHFFGSLSSAFLRETVTALYTGNTTGTYTGPFRTQQTIESKFNGVGPRVGIAGDYKFNAKFSMFGDLATSALIGAIQSSTSYASSAQQLLVVYGQSINYQSIADQHVYQVIPAVDAKLAAKFVHKFNSAAVLQIDLGWQAAVYINAISQYLPQSLVTGQPLETGGIFVATMVNKVSNYSVQGPFIKLAFAI